MRHGWLNGSVFFDSQSRSSFCILCLLRTYGWSSHRTCTSTCFHRPSCLGLTWAHLLPFPLKSWPLISDFKASKLIGEIFKVFICPQVPTFQTALVGLDFIFCFWMICNLVTWESLGRRGQGCWDAWLQQPLTPLFPPDPVYGNWNQTYWKAWWMWHVGQVGIGWEERKRGAWGTMHVKMWPTTHLMLQTLHQIPVSHLCFQPAPSPVQQRCTFLLETHTHTCAHTHSHTALLHTSQHWLLIRCLRFRMKEYIKAGTVFLSMKEHSACRICPGLHSNINMYHNTIPSSSNLGCSRALELNEQCLKFYPTAQGNPFQTLSYSLCKTT